MIDTLKWSHFMFWIVFVIITFILARYKKGTIFGLILWLITMFFAVKFLIFLHHNVGAVGVVGTLLLFGAVVLGIHYRDTKLQSELNDSLKRYEALVRERDNYH